jgi:hypothetical protein
VVPGGEDVGEQRVVGLALGARGQRQAVEVGVRDPQVLRLPAGIRSHRNVAVRPAREARRVDREAEAGEARLAVLAEATGYVERHHHAVAFLEAGDAAAHLLDDAEVLVAEHDARFRGGPALVHVQIGPADAGRGDPHDHVVGLLDARVGHLFHRDLERLPVDHRPHARVTPFLSPCAASALGTHVAGG